MAMRLPDDFKEFLKSLNENRVRYLVVGGYAVGFHGYPRATGDLDVWIEVSRDNAERVARAVRDFGFDVPDATPEAFLKDDAVIRMGMPPLQIEVMTRISGAAFAECYKRRTKVIVDDLQVAVISRSDLVHNKQSADRNRDRDDLEHFK